MLLIRSTINKLGSALFILTLLFGMGGLGVVLTASASAAVGLSIDSQTSGKTTGGSTVTSSGLTTTQQNDLLVAFLGSDGPASSRGQTFSSISGGGLKWQLKERTNTQYGGTEIWTAVAVTTLSNVTVKATHSGSYASSIYVVAFGGANTSANVGAVSSSSGVSGAPTTSLTTTQAGSWVWATGNDWSNAIGRMVGSGQTLQNQYLNTGSGDSFWTQSENSTTISAGTKVTINDTAPTNDMWNMAAVEVVPAFIDTTPPTAPQNVVVSSPNSYEAVLTWNASTDNVGVAGYNVYRNGTLLTQGVTTTTYTDSSLAPNTTYSYTVVGYDAAGNASPQSAAAVITTGQPDTTPPVVSMTQPGNNSTLSGTVTIGANASDDVSVSSVQFTLTNMATNAQTNLGGAITSSPYSFSWSTAGVTNGNYALSAIATDEAGNAAIATPVDVTVDNTAPVAPSVDSSSPAAIGIPGSTCSNPVQSVSTPTFSAPANSRIYVVATADSYPTGVSNCLGETAQNSISSISASAGSSWSRVMYTTQRNSAVGGFVDVWTTTVPAAQQNTSFTVNFAQPMKAEPSQVSPSGLLQVIVVDNAGASQTVNPVAVDQLNSMTTTASATVNSVPANSLVFMAVDYWNSYSTPPSTPTGQSVIGNINNRGETDTWTVSDTSSPTISGPQPVTLSQTIADLSRPSDNWHAIAWAVTP